MLSELLMFDLKAYGVELLVLFVSIIITCVIVFIITNYEYLKLKVFKLIKNTTNKTGNKAIPELIVCAAIKYPPHETYPEGIIIPSVRHYDEFAGKIIDLFPINIYTELLKNTHIEVEQGFLTNKHRFVSREEAYIIAKENNQIKRNYEITKKLYSEHLY